MGGGVGALVTGVLGWFAGRGKRNRDSAADQAATSEYKADATISDAAASQIKALLDRVESLESKYTKLWDELQAEKAASSKLRDRVRQLEGILRDNSIAVPPET